MDELTLTDLARVIGGAPGDAPSGPTQPWMNTPPPGPGLPPLTLPTTPVGAVAWGNWALGVQQSQNNKYQYARQGFDSEQQVAQQAASQTTQM
jgi:hypothetical protein